MNLRIIKGEAVKAPNPYINNIQVDKMLITWTGSLYIYIYGHNMVLHNKSNRRKNVDYSY